MKKLILISALLFSFNGWAECIKGNCTDGVGTFLYDEGHTYKGMFRDGDRHGRGTYIWPSGTQYVGQWKDNKQHGRGTYTDAYGNQSVSQWKDGKEIELRSTSSQNSSQSTPSNRSQARTDAINALMGGLVGAGGFLLLAFIILGVIGTLYFYSKKIAVKAKPKIESTAYSAGVKTKKIFSKLTKSEMEQFLEIDDKYFQIATDEIESNTQQQGLWMKVGALAEGNIEKQKALYIKHRAKQLSKKS